MSKESDQLRQDMADRYHSEPVRDHRGRPDAEDDAPARGEARSAKEGASMAKNEASSADAPRCLEDGADTGPWVRYADSEAQREPTPYRLSNLVVNGKLMDGIVVEWDTNGVGQLTATLMAAKEGAPMEKNEALHTGRLRLLIMGHGRHGKDTFAEMLGLPFESSSMAACRECVWPVMGWRYDSIEKCFNDRVNHRDEWKRLVSEYNREDPTRLASAIYGRFDVYVGIRSRVEFEAVCAKFNPLIIYVDRGDHLPADTTFDMTFRDAHLYVDNNGSLQSLRLQAGLIRSMLATEEAAVRWLDEQEGE